MTATVSGASAASDQQTDSERQDAWRRRRPVILVADDDAADRELLRRALLQYQENCDVRMVADGVELLDYLENRVGQASESRCPAPDLMIVDLKMPRKDGRQALLAINGRLEITTPVVIFSGSDDLTDVKACYRAGCNSYVIKPIDLKRFNSAVQGIASYWLRTSKLPPPVSG